MTDTPNIWLAAVVGYAIGIVIAAIIIYVIDLPYWGRKYKEMKNKRNEYLEAKALQHKIKSLHSHPVTEQRDGVVKNKVLVDKEFEFLFNRVFTYWDEEHILVSREEFNTIKKSGKPAPNYYDKILD